MLPVVGLKVGDKVVEGQLLGHNATSGSQSGPHLHFKMWKRWQDSGSGGAPGPPFKAWELTPGAAPLPTKTPAIPATTTMPSTSAYTTVKRGSRGAAVGKVQRALKAKAYTKHIIDDDFGAQTDANVRD